MLSKPLTTFSSGEMDRNECDHVTQRERVCFGFLSQHTIALKRQWIWLAEWPDMRCQRCLHMLSSVWSYSTLGGDWSDLFTVLKRVGHAVWAQHVHTCEGPIVPWVSRGVVEVRGQLHSSRSANRRPALTVSNTTQEDCGNVSRSLIWWSLACWCFSWLWIFHDVIDSLQHRPRRKFGEFIGCFSFVLPILMFLVFVL